MFHCGYNNDMTGVAPEASLISCRVDWTPYFVYAISAVANGESFDQDWTAGYADGSVKLTELNTALPPPALRRRWKRRRRSGGRPARVRRPPVRPPGPES